jgi:hypothetical protein
LGTHSLDNSHAIVKKASQESDLLFIVPLTHTIREPFMKYEIKALSLGDILDQGIRLVREKFGLLMGIMAFTVIPANLVVGYLAQSIQPTPGQMPQQVPPGILGLLAGCWLLLVFVVIPLANAAVVYAAAQTYLGKAATLGECFGHGFRRIPALLWTSILMGMAIVGGLILLIIPGILCMFWFSLAQQVTVLESINGGPALSRSKALMKGNIGTAFVLGLVLGVINGGLGMVTNSLPAPTNLVFAAILGGVSTLLSTCTFVVFYFSCRCKLDNFDLEVLANEVAAGDSDEAQQAIE